MPGERNGKGTPPKRGSKQKRQAAGTRTAQRRRSSQKCKGASLIDQKAMGGIISARGHGVQARYVAVSIARWLADPSFVGFQSEREEDVDVFLDRGGQEYIEHHQVKTEELDPKLLRQIVEVFVSRNATNVERGLVLKLVVASPYPSSTVRGLMNVLVAYRQTHFVDRERDTTRAATDEDLAARLKRAKLDGYEEFVKSTVFIETGFDGTEQAVTTEARMAGELGALPSYQHLSAPELTAGAQALLREIEQSPRRRWTRDEVHRSLTAAIDRFRIGPPRPEGDLLLIAHQSLTPVGQDWRDIQVPANVDKRRRIPLALDSVSRMGLDAPRPEDIAKACRQITDERGPIRQALTQHATADLLYYGFPHVPLAMLAGAVIGQQRHVLVVEHDRDAGRFAWPGVPVVAGLRPTETATGAGTAALLRISVSALVLREACSVPDTSTAVEIHVGLERPQRGAIQSERAAREVAGVVRGSLDEHVSGRGLEVLHVFAAVPVSVAVLVGQVLNATGLPPARLYNFLGGRYRWCIRLDDALAGRGAVETFGDGATGGGAHV